MDDATGRDEAAELSAFEEQWFRHQALVCSEGKVSELIALLNARPIEVTGEAWTLLAHRSGWRGLIVSDEDRAAILRGYLAASERERTEMARREGHGIAD